MVAVGVTNGDDWANWTISKLYKQMQFAIKIPRQYQLLTDTTVLSNKEK